MLLEGAQPLLTAGFETAGLQNVREDISFVCSSLFRQPYRSRTQPGLAFAMGSALAAHHSGDSLPRDPPVGLQTQQGDSNPPPWESVMLCPLPSQMNEICSGRYSGAG